MSPTNCNTVECISMHKIRVRESDDCKYYFFLFSLELVNGSLVFIFRERVNGVEAYPILVFFLKPLGYMLISTKCPLPFIALNKIFAQTILAALCCKILTEERIKSERLTASHFHTIRETRASMLDNWFVEKLLTLASNKCFRVCQQMYTFYSNWVFPLFLCQARLNDRGVKQQLDYANK